MYFSPCPFIMLRKREGKVIKYERSGKERAGRREREMKTAPPRREIDF